MAIPGLKFPPGENEDGEDFVNQSLIPGILVRAPDPDDPHADERIAAQHRHCPESNEITSLVPQPPHPSDVLPTDETLSEGQLYAPGFGPDSAPVFPIRTNDETLRAEPALSPNDPPPGSVTLAEDEWDPALASQIAGTIHTELPDDDGIDLSIPPLPKLDLAAATRRNSDGSHCVAGTPITDGTNGSPTDVGPDKPALVSPDVLAGIGETVVRNCVANAFRSWASDIVEEGRRRATGSSIISFEDMMRILESRILKNIAACDIQPSLVWPMVPRLVVGTLTYAVKSTFGK